MPGTERRIRSADVELLTSPGLGELKELINEATAKKALLRSEQSQRATALKKASGRLKFAEWVVIRLFTGKLIPTLVEKANTANDQMEETTAHLEGCFVEVDFAFDEATSASYQALVDAFDRLRTSQRIWDITATAHVDRVAQRTTAHSALTRVPVTYDFAESEIIRSQHRPMRLGNVDGRDLQIFPGFVMMREASRDFALIEFAGFECRYAPSNFIEEDTVPSDAERVGASWKRANKDGSRDRRFNGNYQIPVVRYGGLVFSSGTGLGEAYHVSDWAKAQAFSQALASHKHALANMNVAADLTALPAPSDLDKCDDEPSEREPVFVAKRRDHLAVDWVILGALLTATAVGSAVTNEHWSGITRAFSQPAPSQAAPIAAQAPPSVAPKRGRHVRHHHSRSATIPVAPRPSTDEANPKLDQLAPEKAPG